MHRSLRQLREERCVKKPGRGVRRGAVGPLKNAQRISVGFEEHAAVTAPFVRH